MAFSFTLGDLSVLSYPERNSKIPSDQNLYAKKYLEMLVFLFSFVSHLKTIFISINQWMSAPLCYTADLP